jgi:hypothetical protein
MHTALLHDQTINERLGYNVQGYLGSARLRSQIEMPSLMAKTTTLSSLGPSSRSVIGIVRLLQRGLEAVDQVGNTCLGMKGCMAPRGSSICLSYSLTHNPGDPQWSLHHTDLVFSHSLDLLNAI